MLDLAKRRAEEKRHHAARMKEAGRLIAGKFEDARAHAMNALTATLDATTAGRPTIARIRRDRSYGAALARLDELAGQVVDLCERCRVDEYKLAYAHWFADTPEEFRRSASPTPPEMFVNRCRTTVIHEHTLESWVAGPIRNAKGALLRSLASAGNLAVSGRESTDVLRRWRDIHAGHVMDNVESALVDGQTMADARATRDVYRRDMVKDHPTLPD